MVHTINRLCSSEIPDTQRRVCALVAIPFPVLRLPKQQMCFQILCRYLYILVSFLLLFLCSLLDEKSLSVLSKIHLCKIFFNTSFCQIILICLLSYKERISVPGFVTSYETLMAKSCSFLLSSRLYLCFSRRPMEFFLSKH